MSLPAPARYYPWTRGIYDVAPGLRPFGTDFGNGEADRRVFQIDDQFDIYADNKRRCLRERRGKYVRALRLSREVEWAAIDLITNRLATEYPARYRREVHDRHISLFDGDTRYDLGAMGRHDRSDGLDFLCRLVQEDVAIVQTLDQSDWVSYLHLCSPSHWSAEAKIGRSFFDVHEPIPAFERVNAVASTLVETMVGKGPFVRFVWGVESDDRLNHHPEPPPGEDPVAWNGRTFDSGRFWVRTERQVIWGMPSVGASLFTIRVAYVSDIEVLADERLHSSLRAALYSMSPAAREYKGIAKYWDRLTSLVG